jgi:hypothetical protein
MSTSRACCTIRRGKTDQEGLGRKVAIPRGEVACPARGRQESMPNLTAATSNLFDLVQARQLVLYPDDAMRLAISRAIVTESSRGWKLDKARQSHKIDIVVALSMAAYATIKGLEEPDYDAELLGLAFGDGSEDKSKTARDAEYQSEFAGMIYNVTGHWPR